MDSFFSLFDPSDGNKSSQKNPTQDNVKKKTEASGKGRRRSRRSQNKNDTLPEECSFLCSPELSSDVQVSGGYIDSYMEMAATDKSESEDKPRRRNSGRKYRRKRNKITPSKDLVANSAWFDSSPEHTNWNNQSDIPKVCDENIGKNVNDLTGDFKKIRRKASNEDSDGTTGSFEDTVYSVVDSIDKVKIKDDLFLAGDFDESDLESDFLFQSDDDLDETFDDSTSEPSDSECECYGRLPPEPRFGNVEYKLQLVAPCERRFQHLVTQLKWRLISGGGCAVYVVGVRDCGAVVGARARVLRATLRTVRRMAAALRADIARLTVRSLARDRAVAELYIRKLADAQQSVELRVAVMGANEAGKSTLIGVLTQGELDNGRGSARLNMFRHEHEVKSGRTSSLSHEILGFDAQGNVVNYGCSELMTAERIGERSAKLVSFLDLAGHSKYQRTTLHGLTGYCPHYAMIVISATAGITRITEEHISLLLALDLPFFAVVTKTDLSGAAPTVARLGALLAPANKTPVLIKDEKAARERFASHDSGNDNNSVLVFPVSCVSGAGVCGLLHALHQLAPPAGRGAADTHQESVEFQIDEIFRVGDSTGPVVGGLLASGRLAEGDKLILGPLETGEFTPISVKSIYRNRVPHGYVKAGQCASLGLSAACALRPGMVLLAPPAPVGHAPAGHAPAGHAGHAPAGHAGHAPAGHAGHAPAGHAGHAPAGHAGHAPAGHAGHAPAGHAPGKLFGACTRCCTQVQNLLQSSPNSRDNPKSRKFVRRKHKNLIQDLETVESSLRKESHVEDANLYRRSDEDAGNTDKKDISNYPQNYKDNITVVKSNLNTAQETKTVITNELRVANTALHDENSTVISTQQNKPVNNNAQRVANTTIHEANTTVITPQQNKAVNTDEQRVENTALHEANTTVIAPQNVNVNEMKVVNKVIDAEADQIESNAFGGCECGAVPLANADDPRGAMYFQAWVHVLRHSTAIYPGFQCTVHVGNVRQTAIIEGILSHGGVLRCGERASVVFRFCRWPEYLAPHRRMLFTAGLGTRAIGRVTQVFPYFP